MIKKYKVIEILMCIIFATALGASLCKSIVTQVKYENEMRATGFPFMDSVHEASIKYQGLKENLEKLESYGVDISNGPAGALPDIIDLLEICY